MQEQESIQNQYREPQVSIHADGLSTEARELFDCVARRAYEIFESKGRPLGTDLENWFQAEQELFERTPLQLSESANQLSLAADVHNYMSKELEVDLEPRRVTIIGRRDASGRKQGGDGHTKKSRMLLSLQLPFEVDPHHATARMKRGVLQLNIAKIPGAQASRPQAAAHTA